MVLCRRLDLLAQASVAIDGSKFKAVNAHDRNFTSGSLAYTLLGYRVFRGKTDHAELHYH
ncbi:hypothetical protein A6V36_23705 [Paraburkholderia ginsengiterrae]|uniref:Uncharacterized protein n=1 Tax=Paraburkholderia ginsengiterrae TaxID=1462993 RepID=A0A1A9NGS8_9BURK|nr:hypothetical protein A6V36_23705 [Paraburkholderia ginsengiterrae]OAJ65354.1 hypothetical protein A6V37_15460 [Paraburkholderia ginsengiterrae]